jgi:hypothetical protein
MLIRATHLIPTDTFSYFLLLYLLLPQYSTLQSAKSNSIVAAALLYWLFPDYQCRPIVHAASLTKKSCHPYHHARSRCATRHYPSAHTGHSLSDAPLHPHLMARARRARRAVASRPELIPFAPVVNHLSPSIKGRPVTCCSTSPSLEAEQPLSNQSNPTFLQLEAAIVVDL